VVKVPAIWKQEDEHLERFPKLTPPGKNTHIMDKSAIRKATLSKIQALGKAVVSVRSAALYDALVHHSVFQESNAIALFASMEHELSTELILKHALEAGKVCYLPRIVFDPIPPEAEVKVNSDGKKKKRPSRIKMLRVFSFEDDFKKFEKHKWGIAEPPDEPEREMQPGEGLDLIILPGVAFDANRNRIGYGMGYYDRLLAFYKDKAMSGELPRMPYLLGVGMTEQSVQEVPVDQHDFTLDEVMLV
jgi:5-formyltetrahydrofolate cyclo-ligase